MHLIAVLVLSLLAMVHAPAAAWAENIQSGHAMAMHGEPKYPADFEHFDYVNPEAPKGGTLRLGVTGTFDSFNPFVIKGNAFSNIGVETLTTASADEPFTRYGLIAESMEWPEDRSWITFTLRPEARWHDGTPITVEDVIFSLETLKTKGQPFYRFYYGTIDRAEKVGERKVRFVFNEAGNRELPLIAGEMPILSKAYWENRDFERSSLEPPLTSGPYKVSEFEAGRYVVVERVDDYWGKDLAVNVGQDNFDRIRYDYFRDDTVLRQALKAGVIDYRDENQAKAWALDYDVPAVRDGWLKKEAIEHHRPTGMQAFVFNTRRPVFSDPKVREALAYAFDFEWSNRTLFFDQYARTESYFSNSDLASRGLPEGEELELLEKYRGRVPEEVFTEEYRAPSTDGGGWPRANLEKAFELLAEAGWEVRDMKLVNVETGEPMRFEILLVNQAFERIVLPFARNLKRLGIEASVRLVDESQYINRARSYDFDMIVGGWGQSESPGNEQRSYWTSAAAEAPGSRNFAGIEDPVVDELVELIISAPDRESLVARTRALDRVLLSGYYVIPNWHLRNDRILYWDKFSRPEVTPDSGTSTSLWWFDPEKAERLEQRRITSDIDEPGAADTPGVGTVIAWAAGLGIAGFVVFRRVMGRKESGERP
jgi:microcin C transport system substrate-binding protein